jgi:hypothetical protein
MSFARVTASSAERGYDYAHRQEAKRRIANATEADPCGYCRRPLGPRYGVQPRTGQRITIWILPHNTNRTGWLPGLWHHACNATEAGKRARARQDATRLRW